MTSDLQISFEFFPPKTEEMEASLWRAICQLAPLHPRFVSVTYGAGGSTRERTHATVKRILEETDLVPAAHLTCVAASRAEVDEVVRSYGKSGIRHIVALRGDPPDAHGPFTAHPEGYRNAEELVRGIRAIGDFEIRVAAYPEVHPEATSPEADLDYLKRKIDAGASRAITQFFFDPDVYLRFLDRTRAAGIQVPIVPGILPVTHFARTCQFASRCGATIPPSLGRLFEGLDEDPAMRKLVAVWAAADLCRTLQNHGIREFHFYTLNRAELTRSICHILGVRASTQQASTAKAAAS